MKLITITLIILVNSNSFGQNLDTLYLDSLYKEVEFKLEATFTRVITGYNSSIDRYNATDFNRSGQKVFEGQLRFVNSGSVDGDFLYYFDNGQLRLKGSIKNAFDKGLEFEEELWHPNGVRQGNTSFKNEFIIHNHFDTLGRSEVRNGNGRCAFISYLNNTIHEGQVTDGKKQGIWIIYDFKRTPIAREHYKDGKLSKGYKLIDENDSIPYKYFAIGDNVMITKRIEREIKRQIRNQLSQKNKDTQEVGYYIHIKENKIIDVQLLRDNFIIKNNITLSNFPLGQKYNLTVEGDQDAEEVWPMKFKMKI